MRKVFLVGFMGCGKSSFGRLLARRLGWEFVDIDREIEHRAGMSIAGIFERQGEERFRELERMVVEDAAADGREAVVALGGGALGTDGTVEMLLGAGEVVYLKMSPEKLVRRMSQVGRARRPKIAGMDDDRLLDYIEKTLPEREKRYNKANFVVDCDALSDDAIVRLLVQHIDNSNVIRKL